MASFSYEIYKNVSTGLKTLDNRFHDLIINQGMFYGCFRVEKVNLVRVNALGFTVVDRF